jgi:hypothetical protein
MKTFIKLQALAVLIGCHIAIKASATLVSYGFSGTVTSLQNPSNALPAGIAYGTPFTGAFTYDTTANVLGIDFNNSTNAGDFYFGTNGGFSLFVTLAGHTFATTKHASNSDPYADFIVHNDLNGHDTLEVGDGNPNVVMDGSPIPGNPDVSGLTLSFYDYSATALDTDAMPTVPPLLSSFPDRHQFEIVAIKSQDLLFSFKGTITNIVSLMQPQLNLQLQPNKTVLLSWPLAAQGFILEQNTNLTAGIGWQTNAAAIIDTSTDHTVTLPTSDSMFFRLKAP